jgi:hypothetical protein
MFISTRRKMSLSSDSEEEEVWSMGASTSWRAEMSAEEESTPREEA